MASLPAAVRSAPKFAPRLAPNVQRRAVSDVAITRTGKPIIRVQGGRSVPCVPAQADPPGESLLTCPCLQVRLRRYAPSRPPFQFRPQLPLPLSNASGLTGHTATVFGATGALGRYIVNRLGSIASPRKLVNGSETGSLTGLVCSAGRMPGRGPVPGGDGEAPSQGDG